jgi:hypothetical protein
MPGKNAGKDIFDDWELFFYLALAGFFIAGFGLFPALVVGLSGETAIGNMFFLLCIPLPTLAGVICLAIGLRGRKHYKQHVELADILVLRFTNRQSLIMNCI